MINLQTQETILNAIIKGLRKVSSNAYLLNSAKGEHYNGYFRNNQEIDPNKKGIVVLLI